MTKFTRPLPPRVNNKSWTVQKTLRPAAWKRFTSDSLEKDSPTHWAACKFQSELRVPRSCLRVISASVKNPNETQWSTKVDSGGIHTLVCHGILSGMGRHVCCVSPETVLLYKWLATNWEAFPVNLEQSTDGFNSPLPTILGKYCDLCLSFVLWLSKFMLLPPRQTTSF